jgi:hypothetical protein
MLIKPLNITQVMTAELRDSCIQNENVTLNVISECMWQPIMWK